MTENILQNKKVLVVDDNVINQMVVKHSLIKLGASTDIAGDGREAITQFKKAHYDLVLMDIQMPNMDGYDATRYFRNQLKSDIPIIAMTAFALKGEDEKCFECGMNGYVSKPFTLESLYNSISKAIYSDRVVPTNPNILTRGDAVVDISMLYEIAGNDEAYIEAMISTFIENLPMVIAKMEAAYAKREWQGVYKAAHYAKSSLSVVKIPGIFECVKAIEDNAKDEVNLQDIPGLLRNIKQKFAVAENILNEKLNFKAQSTIA